MTVWETIEAPSGRYVGWSTTGGQHVTGRVISYDPAGGTDFNGGVCPLLEVELTEKAASFSKDGSRTDFDPGEVVRLTIGQVNLKDQVRRANPTPGDLVKITMAGTEKAANGNTFKRFTVQIAKDAATATPAVDSSEPPF